MHTDVLVVGAGLSGLVATAELVAAGKRVVLVDQESAVNLGGQAFWSFGGLFLVDSPEQRRLGVKDSAELALADWMGSADFSTDGSDRWGRAWAEGFVDFAAGDLRPWLYAKGVRWSRAIAVWTPDQINALAANDLARGFVDDIETPIKAVLATNP